MGDRPPEDPSGDDDPVRRDDLPEDPFGGDDPVGDEGGSTDDPFAGFGMFGDLAKLFGGAAPGATGVPWATARQVAVGIASGGQTEANVDPALRRRLADLSRIAELHVANVTGLELTVQGTPPVLVPLNRSEWAARTLTDLQPLLQVLGARLGSAPQPPPPDEAAGDPFASLFGNLMGMLAPTITAMTAGGMVGQLAQRSLGSYDLPLPRPVTSTIHVVGPNIDDFAREWSVPLDDLCLWLCLHDLTLHTLLGVPHLRAELDTLLTAYVDGFAPTDGSAFEDRLSGLDLDLSAGPEAMQQQLQSMFGDPEVLLGAMRSPAQDELLPRIQAVIAVLVGMVDHVVDEVGAGLIGSAGMLSEALRRRRVGADQAQRFVEKLLGVEISRTTVARGQGFVAGVVERTGATSGLQPLWTDASAVPTPAEIDAPGLWLARLGVDVPLPDADLHTDGPDDPGDLLG